MVESVAVFDRMAGWLREKESVPFVIEPPVAVWIWPVMVPPTPPAPGTTWPNAEASNAHQTRKSLFMVSALKRLCEVGLPLPFFAPPERHLFGLRFSVFITRRPSRANNRWSPVHLVHPVSPFPLAPVILDNQ